MKIFIATSFSGQVDQSGQVLPKLRKTAQHLLSLLRSVGHEVYCAAEDEGWAISQLPPEVGAREDLEIIDKYDIVIALLGKDISAGVQFEVGYAVKAGKQLIYLLREGATMGWFNQGVVNAGWAKLATLENLIQILANEKAAG